MGNEKNNHILDVSNQFDGLTCINLKDFNSKVYKD